jgi:NAD(P)-dependent dehydrogenase (short-subunit alcohol dehydrogenase family)
MFEFAMRINVIGTFDLTRRTLEHLIQNDPEGEDGERGIIIMVSSAAAVSQNTCVVGPHLNIRSSRAKRASLPMPRPKGRYAQ